MYIGPPCADSCHRQGICKDQACLCEDGYDGIYVVLFIVSVMSIVACHEIVLTLKYSVANHAPVFLGNSADKHINNMHDHDCMNEVPVSNFNVLSKIILKYISQCFNNIVYILC